jgi:hypothetical protein
LQLLLDLKPVLPTPGDKILEPTRLKFDQQSVEALQALGFAVGMGRDNRNGAYRKR